MAKILRALFARRPDAPWFGYVPVLVVVGFFTSLGVHEGVLGVLHFIILFVVALLQLRYRTFAGWILFFNLFVIYGLIVLINPDSGHIGEYVLFAACGFVPAAVLLIGRPRNVFRAVGRE